MTCNKHTELINILLIEDDPGDMELIRIMLSEIDEVEYQMNSVNRLIPAKELIRNSNTDIILIETFCQVQDVTQELPIIVLSGLSDEEIALDAVSMGAQDYLIKGEVNSKLLNRTISYSIQRKKIQKALRDSESNFRILSRQLQETNELKNLMLDILTHDLKDTASSIYGLTSLMLNDNSQLYLLDSVVKSCNSMINLIENASVMAKIACDEDINREPLELGDLIRDCINEFSIIQGGKRVNIEFNTTDPLQVNANQIISEVFKNYISNAIKYVPKNEKIVIDAYSSENEYVIVKVKDQGETISKEDREIIFQRRVQLRNGYNHGSGLGLAIVKKIADLHKGHVWVEPNLPTGNSFCLKLNKYEAGK